ncbi:MAG TPA: mercury resistance system transport protein MerF [Gammaproteobacteria bacterium]|nr:mercury resistance system transport protein MerF [Gammaproteobacteria bacterium]
MTKARKLLGVGIGGTAISAICCFTPALVILLGGLGLSAWLAWLDYILLPVLAAFIGLTLFALMRLRRGPETKHPDG